MSRPRPVFDIGERSLTHGHSVGRKLSPTYVSWASMIARCYNPKATGYSNYGGAGVKVAFRWRKFENFLADMGKRPSLGHSIDRHPKRNGHYKKKNCRWATRSEQALNRKSTRPVIRSDGMRFASLKEAAEYVNGNRRCIRDCCTGRQKTHYGMGYRYAK